LFIVARAEKLRYDVKLIVVMLGVLGQLRSDVEFCFAARINVVLIVMSTITVV
jgi:hypothetical protein